MVFVYLGSSPDSWAVGNDYFSAAQNLPLHLQEMWNSLGDAYGDASKAGTIIEWLSTSADGSYILATKGGERIITPTSRQHVYLTDHCIVLSNRPDVITAAQPQHGVDHISLAPLGGAVISFHDASIQLVAPNLLPVEFHKLLTHCIDTHSHACQHHAKLKRVVFGGNGAVIASTDRGVLMSGQVPGNLSFALQRMFNNTSAVVPLSKASTLCHWNENSFFIGVDGSENNSFIHQIPPQIPRDFTDSVQQSDTSPSPHLPTLHEAPPSYSAIRSLLARNQSKGLLSNLQQSLDGQSRGLLTNLNKLKAKANAPRQNPAAPSIPPDAKARYERTFQNACDGKPYLTGIEAAIIFLNSGQHKHAISRIWEQTDFNRDGRFTRDEFVQAMWMIETEEGAEPQMQNAMQAQQQSDPYLPMHSANAVPCSRLPGQFHQSLPPVSQPGTSTHQQQSAPFVHPRGFHSSAFQTMEMREPMICRGCDEGLIPGDVVYQCDKCPASDNTSCGQCNLREKRCYHEVPRYRLEAAPELKREDAEGDFGESVKCDGCRTKLKDGMLCWHCKRCFDPNYCKDCWKQAGKRCKHAKNGKVQLRRMGKSSSSSAGDILEAVGDILLG